MGTQLTDWTTDDASWPGPHPSRTGARLMRKAQKTFADFLVRRALLKAEAQLMALDDHMLEDIGLDRREIGSVLMEGADKRRNGARRRRRQHRESGA